MDLVSITTNQSNRVSQIIRLKEKRFSKIKLQIPKYLRLCEAMKLEQQ